MTQFRKYFVLDVGHISSNLKYPKHKVEMNFYYETVLSLVDPKKPTRNQIRDPNYGY